jgi:hypothetical protein|tara:strand:- start:755 stop:1153 length:399 start_codon:yes stop_codon:yes gene_type:complete
MVKYLGVSQAPNHLLDHSLSQLSKPIGGDNPPHNKKESTMDKYRVHLEASGLDSDHTYKAASRLGDMHELFSQLSDDNRWVLQQLWGEKFIRQLERYGKETGKQSTLIIDPSYYAEVSYSHEEEAFAESMHP